MSVSLSPYAGAGAQFFDNNGNPLAGGKIFTYAAGTTTPLATYTDYTGNTANPVYPVGIVLDSAGRTPAQIWLTEGLSYKFVLQTSLGVTIKTDDNIFASYELSKAIGVSVGLGAGSVPTNIAVGDTALDSNTSGSNNTAVGYNAMTANTDGFQNTAVGSEALDANTTGTYNTAVGYQSLTAAGAAIYNTGIGYRALNAATTGSRNTAIGGDAGLLISTGSSNVAVGFSSLSSYTGSNATAVGRSALSANTTGADNTAVGKDALLALGPDQVGLPLPQAGGHLQGLAVPAFDGQHLAAIGLRRQHSARLDRAVVEVHGAAATLRGVAADVGAGQCELIADDIDEQGMVGHLEAAGRAVERKLDAHEGARWWRSKMQSGS